MEKVYIETNGCAVLRHETYKIAKYVELNGFKEVEKPEEADYIIITGCAVIDSNEDFAIQSIKRLYYNNHGHAKIIVAGCISTIASQRISNISKDIIQIKNNEMEKFNNVFYNNYKLDEVYFNINPKRHHSFGDPQIVVTEDEEKDLIFSNMVDEISNEDKLKKQFDYSTRGHHLWREKDLFEIRVSYGCSHKCSYCATRNAIGDFRSIDMKKVLMQAMEAKNKGYTRIMLMGDEIGAWSDGEKNIVDLINALVDIDSNFKIGIRYIHPDFLAKYYVGLQPLLEKGNIYYFCSAFQSGSKKVLKLMNRNPNLDEFVKCMEDINKNQYPVYCHTQIIVGFPGETESDVLDTLNILQKTSFDHVTITPYSKRKGTLSYEYDELPQEVVNKRVEIFNNWLELNRNSKLYKTARNELIKKYVKKGNV